MFEVSKTFYWEMGHRLLSEGGPLRCYSKEKCGSFHGHNYSCEVFIQSDVLNEWGMVVDYGSKLFQSIEEWIKEYFDHAMLLTKGDPLLPALKKDGVRIYTLNALTATAENIAAILYTQISLWIVSKAEKWYGVHGCQLRCSRVVVHETSDTSASYSE
jgi:6-pyruvoyl-tetrahydropterin synthase